MIRRFLSHWVVDRVIAALIALVLAAAIIIGLTEFAR